MANIYFRLMLGPAGCYASECLKNNYIGVDFNVNEDLTGKFVVRAMQKGEILKDNMDKLFA